MTLQRYLTSCNYGKYTLFPEGKGHRTGQTPNSPKNFFFSRFPQSGRCPDSRGRRFAQVELPHELVHRLTEIKPGSAG
jgi:hypothetical protein